MRHNRIASVRDEENAADLHKKSRRQDATG